MRRIGFLVLVLALVLLSPVRPWAGTVDSEQNVGVPYTAVLSVDETAVTVTIDFNGDAIADRARLVILYNTAGSGVYCIDRGTATAVGAPLVPGSVLNFPLPGSTWLPTRLSCVCSGGGCAATVYLYAFP